MPIRAFIVWEPVLVTDIAPPTGRVLARAKDSRVAQYWDEHLLLSKEIVRSARADTTHALHAETLNDDTIIWDFVATFPPDALWESSFPTPDTHGYPVVGAVDALRARMKSETPTAD